MSSKLIKEKYSRQAIFQAYSIIVLGLNLLFFRYLSKIDARTHLRLYFKHICVVLLIVVFRFSKKITFVPQKRTILGHIHHLTPWIRPIQDVFDICHQS